MAYATRYAYGGFLYNNYDENIPISLSLTPMEHDPDNFAVVGSIKGDIISNIAIAGRETYGGAIYNNEGKINSITANLIANNYALYMNVPEENSLNVTPADASVNTKIPELEFNSGDAYGGFLYNRGYGVIGNITATAFLNNSARAGRAHGGAIYNDAKIGKISGDFIGNNVLSNLDSAFIGGGAIYNGYNGGTIDNITGNFDGNYVFLDYDQRLEVESLYPIITPKTLGPSEAIGGAIYNQGEIGNIKGNFSNNYISMGYTRDGYAKALGGAIFNGYNGNIESIVGDFVKNSVSSDNYVRTAGGAIYNYEGEIGYISGNFLNNYAKTSHNDGLALGGAIYNYYSDLNFVADGKAYKISGNYTQDSRGKINNAIWMQEDWHYSVARPSVSIDSINISTKSNKLPQFLTFNVTNKGSYTIDDIIDGGYANGDSIEYEGYGYNLLVTGDACPECEYNSVRFNSTVNNVLNFGIEKAQVALGKNAKVFVTNNYYAMNNPWLRVDVDASAETSGKLYIDGDVYGTTQVIANIINYKDIGEKSIVFAEAYGDVYDEDGNNAEASKAFAVYRTVGSPYKWYVKYEEDGLNIWSLAMGSEANDYEEDCPELAPEEPETPEVFDGFMPTLDRIKEGIQVVDYISDVEALPNSAFAYEAATSGDNSFSFTDTNAYGAESDKAYKIVLKPEEFSTSTDLTFTADDSGSIEVQLPNGETQYFSYEYTGDGNDAAINLGQNVSGDVAGGVIFNWDEGDITADFVENYVSSSDGIAIGGAIFNDDNTIGDITGDFVGNSAEGYAAAGSAIVNGFDNPETSVIGDITGSFIGNYSISTGDGASAGAIANMGTIGNITGDFIGNYAESNTALALGGAIMNGLEAPAELGNITGDFIANHVKGIGALGGAIANLGANIEDITGDFIGNYAEGEMIAVGGAIAHAKTPQDNIGSIGTINGSFINNYVKVTGTDGIGLGGAIFVSDDDLAFKADGITNRFSGNYVENANGSKVNNAIFVNNNTIDSPLNLDFEVRNNGAIVFDDEIDGGYLDTNANIPTIVQDGYAYNINIYGDVCPQCIVNSVIFNSKVKNVYNLTLDTTQMVLGKDAHIEIVNDYIAQNNPYLRLNVDAVNGKTGQLEIGGQVEGTTQVIANIVNYKDVRGEESIVFATAVNDTTGDEESFKIFRTVGSPYKWYVDYDETAKTWGLAMGEETNDYEEDCYPSDDEEEDTPSDNKPLGPIEVEPEIIAMEALPSAAIAQTNGMIYNIMRKVNVNRLYCPGCGFYDYNWNGEAFHNLWVDTTYNGLEIDAPVEIEAKVWGIEAGSDIQRDLHNKLGIFVSYRQGNYEMDGKGDKYFAKLGSELDIDSYLAGLYYRYDNNNWYAFATLYGGMQEAEINTDDGVSTDTDGIEFGGSAEVGYSYALNKTVYVTPSLGVFYTQVSYDDASDNYGKTVEYNDLKQVELEAGLKLSKAVYTDNGAASIYVKPSVVQTLVDGDEVTITEIGKVDTIDDETLGRIEIGGNYGFNDNWSAYGWANYTFGSDYEATSIGAGVNYAW